MKPANEVCTTKWNVIIFQFLSYSLQDRGSCIVWNTYPFFLPYVFFSSTNLILGTTLKQWDTTWESEFKC